MARRLVIRGNSGQLRKASSFSASAAIHGSLLAWLLFSAATRTAPRPRTIYEQEIQPFEKHLVWYNLRDKLPDVKPAATSRNKQLPRARVRFLQSIVAGRKDDHRPPQMIAMPAPAIELPKALALPNVLAVAAPKPVRRFAPPPVAPATVPSAPALPEAPHLVAELKAKPLDLAAPAAHPVRPFTPPDEPRPVTALPAPLTLPDAPRLSASTPATTLPLAAPVTGPRRAFSAPAMPARQPIAEPAGPAAPDLAPAAAVSSELRIPRGFTPPPLRTPERGTPASAIEAPPLPSASTTPDATATLAIVGLNPANTPDIPPPPGSHAAGFSAGLKPRSADTDGGANESAQVTVPGLLTRGGASDIQSTLASVFSPPTSRQNLLEAMHLSVPAAPAPAGGTPGAARVSSAPDGRLSGRYIYTLAIQMPNVTSYSGSWMVWFAEHQQEPGGPPREMRPPVALRKVDPKYIQAAVEERVEGTVRLAAVIRKSGHVESVELLHHLDERLDRSAAEALAKWEFEPAMRDGAPVDIDAVFEIPFRLAPKPKR
jgi:TonB family protein